MPAPSQIDARMLDAEHPEYTAKKKAWGDLALLHASGFTLKAAASNFIVKRPKEKAEIYQLRCQSMVYQDILSTVTGWYGAKLFQHEPQITDNQSEEWRDEF